MYRFLPPRSAAQLLGAQVEEVRSRVDNWVMASQQLVGAPMPNIFSATRGSM